MPDFIFSSYKVVKHSHFAAIRTTTYVSLFATLAQFFSIWIVMLIIFTFLYALLSPLHLPWQLFLVLSILAAIVILKKFFTNIGGTDLLVFNKKGFTIAEGAAILIHYSDVKSIEVHELHDRKLYRLHFILKHGDVIPMNLLCTSHQVLEEIAQLIISQSLSKELIENHISNNILRRVFDNLFSSRLNRKNYLIGMTLALLLLIDISLSSIIYVRATKNPIIEYILLIGILIILVFYYSLVARRRYDIGFAINDPSIVTDNPLPTWYLQGSFIWLTIKLFFMESAKYENQYGKTPDQHIDLKSILGFRRN